MLEVCSSIIISSEYQIPRNTCICFRPPIANQKAILTGPKPTIIHIKTRLRLTQSFAGRYQFRDDRPGPKQCCK